MDKGPCFGAALPKPTWLRTMWKHLGFLNGCMETNSLYTQNRSNQRDKHTPAFNRSAASGKVVSGSGRIWPHSCHLEANDKGDENKRRSSFTKWKVNWELYFLGFWMTKTLTWSQQTSWSKTHTHTSKGNNLVLCLLPSEIMWSGLSCSSTICGFCWNTNLTTFLNMRIKKPWITWLQKPVISNPHNHFPRSCATTGWCQNIFGLNAKKTRCAWATWPHD